MGGESEVGAYAGRWASAFQSGDITQMMSMFHPNAVAYGTRTQAALNGEAAIGKFYDQSFAAASNRRATCQPQVVRQWSADTATIAANCDIPWQSVQNPTAPRSGGPVRLTMRMVRSGGEWRIASQHQSYIPSQTPQLTQPSVQPR